ALEATPSAGRSAFAVIDLRTGATKTFSVTGDMTVDVVSDDATSVYLVEHLRDNRYNVRLYDLAMGKLAETPIVDLKQVELSTAAVTPPEGYRLYAVAEAGVVVVDTATLGLKAHLVPDRAVRSIALTADGRRLYARSLDGTKLWALDAMSGQPIATLAVSP